MSHPVMRRFAIFVLVLTPFVGLADEPGIRPLEKSELNGIWDCRSVNDNSFLIFGESLYVEQYYRDAKTQKPNGRRRFGVVGIPYSDPDPQLQFLDEFAAMKASRNSRGVISFQFPDEPITRCQLLNPLGEAAWKAFAAISLERLAFHYSLEEMAGRWDCYSEYGRYF